MSELPIIDELGGQLHAGFRRREVRRARARAGAAASAALALALALALVIGGGAARPPVASAAAELRAVAHAAETQAVHVPSARQFFFVRRRERVLVPVRRSVNTPLALSQLGAPKALVTFTYWDSTSATRTGRIGGRLLSVRFPTAAARSRWVSLGRPSFTSIVPPPMAIVPGTQISVGAGGLTIGRLEALPPNPRLLARRLFARSSMPQVLEDVAEANLYPLSPALRGAIYRALATFPGIRAAGRARALGGRVGEVFAAPGTPVSAELIVDPRTGAVLGTRTVVTDPAVERLRAGTVIAQEAVVRTAITNRVGPPRG